MMNFLYQNIFKRKSFHLFRDNKSKEQYKDGYHITDDELDNIKDFLIEDISKLSICQKENNIEEYNEFVKKQPCLKLSNISNIFLLDRGKIILKLYIGGISRCIFSQLIAHNF